MDHVRMMCDCEYCEINEREQKLRLENLNSSTPKRFVPLDQRAGSQGIWDSFDQMVYGSSEQSKWQSTLRKGCSSVNDSTSGVDDTSASYGDARDRQDFQPSDSLSCVGQTECGYPALESEISYGYDSGTGYRRLDFQQHFNDMAATGEGIPETGEKISTAASGGDAYTGGTHHGSGTTGGVGFGNKTIEDEDVDTSDTRLEIAHDTRTYSGGTELGSGTTAGPGIGNKMPPEHGGDSRTGKLMEKAGGLFKNEGMVAKGQEKRGAAGAYDDE